MSYVFHLSFSQNTLTTVYVKFDDETAGRRFQDPLHENTIPIKPYSQDFMYKGRHIERTTFPLTPYWV